MSNKREPPHTTHRIGDQIIIDGETFIVIAVDEMGGLVSLLPESEVVKSPVDKVVFIRPPKGDGDGEGHGS
jgi:hypothetical protein